MRGTLRRSRRSILAVALGAAVALAALAQANAADDRPNFLVIVADDLGFSDLGAFGGEIHTPNLDGLARQGLRFTQFHSQSVCAPTRVELLTGTDTHIAGIGWMGGGPVETLGKPGYEGYLNDRVAALPELLQAAGYYTVMAGKWHLGATLDRSPKARGFEHSFGLLGGGQLHFKRTAGVPNIAIVNTPYAEDGQFVDVPDNFYSSDFYASKLIDYLKLQQTNKDKRPFFAYLTFTAPHWPLQIPAEDKDKYKGRYDAGPAALRFERLKRQIALGLLTPAAAADAHPFQYGTPWSDLSSEERAISSRKMEIYAAMVDRLDRNVGKVIDYLQQTGELDKTVIVFLADNGAEGSRIIPPTGWDNSLENLGNVTSFAGYGINWAQAATAPSRLQKEYVSEGGIRVPAFINYAGLRRQHAISREFATIQDITPTILDLADVDHPDTFNGHPIEPMRGTSLVRYLNELTDTAHGPDEVFGWEQFGMRAVRVDNWKAIYLQEPDGRSPRWQLYNLRSDPGERNNLAPWWPGRLAAMRFLWRQYADAVGVVVLPPTAFDPEPY